MTIAEQTILDEPAAEVEGPHAKRFTKAEYYQMAERGDFESRRPRTWLFRGELIEEPPMTKAHAKGIERTTKYAFRGMRPTFVVRVQLPYDAPRDSLVFPDVAIYTSEQADRDPHPNGAELLIEVSYSSRRYDLLKLDEYAPAAREYWIIDVVRRVLHVYRNSHEDPASLYGKVFDAAITLAEDATIAPLCDPAATVVVRDLLPPVA